MIHTAFKCFHTVMGIRIDEWLILSRWDGVGDFGFPRKGIFGIWTLIWKIRQY